MDSPPAEWPKPVSPLSPGQLVERLEAARARLHALVACLPPEGWLGPEAEHLNPPLWEYGHIVWFQERWCLRWRPDGSLAAGRLPNGDALYDSGSVPHDSRWALPLLDPEAARDYGAAVLAALAQRLREGLDPRLAYFAELALYHELMHIEAWWMAWQNLGYAPPEPPALPEDLAPEPGQLAFDDGTAVLGSGPEAGFVFDNEKWRHEVATRAFEIDASPVTEGAYAEFVAAGGYARPALWSAAGRDWLARTHARHPLYWRPQGPGWAVRRFERWQPLAAGRPLLHVNRFEAEAYAAWRGRRLPSAAEWCRAAEHPAFRRGLGWEWLLDAFAPYPGFAPDPYAAYSQPWFHSHGELRGGSPVTDPALARPGYRNFYLPHRRDPYAGLRTARDR